MIPSNFGFPVVLLGLGIALFCPSAVALSCANSAGVGTCQSTSKACDGVSESSNCSFGQICCVPARSNPKCAHPPARDCSFYRNCLESRYNCGSDGYPLGYGEVYCTKSLNARPRFSPQGQQWLDNVMLCLQRSLIPEALEAANPLLKTTCSALKKTAFASHSDCFVNSGLCELPARDWFQLFLVVNVGFLGGIDVFREAVQSVGSCAAFKAWALLNVFSL